MYQLALLHANQGRDEEALKLIEPVTRDYPGYVLGRALAGTVWARQARYDKALDELEAAFALEPAHTNVARYMTVIGQNPRYKERVRAVFQAHLEAHPDDAQVRNALRELSR